MIITLKSAHEGKMKLQIRRKTGFEYKDIEIENLYNFLMEQEFICDYHQEEFIFLMDDKMKNYVAERLENLAKHHNNKSDA
jgi:hypothetical protein